MKHVMYGGKSLLMDSETADVLLEYAGSFGPDSTSDTVSVIAISPDGNEVEVTVLLNASTELISETTDADLDLPSNEIAVSYMRERLDLLRHPRPVQPETSGPATDGSDEYDGVA